jgi:DNA replication protein DnaC
MRSSASNNVPLRFAERTLDSYAATTPSQAAALEAARAIVAGTIKNLVMIGAPGVGKTHLAAAIGNACRFGYRWVNVADALTSMRLEMGLQLGEREATLALRAAGTHRGLVVLDDLGRENSTDWTGEFIYTLVNARYEAMLPTVVTSNRSAADLLAGPYWTAVSRLAEDGRLIEIVGPDRRFVPKGATGP